MYNRLMSLNRLCTLARRAERAHGARCLTERASPVIDLKH